MIATNLAVRFLLEVAGLAALAYAGTQVADGAWGWVLAAVLPAAMIAVWARVAAPKARTGLSQETRQRLGSGILLLAAVALAIAGAPGLAVAYAVAVVANTVVLGVLGAPDTLAAAEAVTR
ncbi:DUF2568 domain-containing protein [Demequina sp. SYSU T00039]|uniref:DUF2568 domain-containing protein n=1 Tax=Demequina lignilytica TaxID=3051663 RepID=A0AAW7M1Y6_9MICO|nr:MULTISPECIES: DUF2568 domain-containing protein [unclassified Demequina]MDN4477381.1 DUF2568 domain-containing protein [Demequina sp. SYSU T00039-1]MDN4487554.1 DUF2568 domain-containing protein [Demequina sp. SYSU T00039]